MKDQRESSASGRRSGAHGAGRWRSLVHGAALLTLVGCVGSQPVERPFSLADLPANVRVSALAAVPGIDLLRVTVRDDGEQPLFILEPRFPLRDRILPEDVRDCIRAAEGGPSAVVVRGQTCRSDQIQDQRSRTPRGCIRMSLNQ